jgi:hypothetical protein
MGHVRDEGSMGSTQRWSGNDGRHTRIEWWRWATSTGGAGSERQQRGVCQIGVATSGVDRRGACGPEAPRGARGWSGCVLRSVSWLARLDCWGPDDDSSLSDGPIGLSPYGDICPSPRPNGQANPLISPSKPTRWTLTVRRVVQPANGFEGVGPVWVEAVSRAFLFRGPCIPWTCSNLFASSLRAFVLSSSATATMISLVRRAAERSAAEWRTAERR